MPEERAVVHVTLTFFCILGYSDLCTKAFMYEPKTHEFFKTW